MKLVDKSGWPKVGTKWNTQDDLLLVCELAAARAGFSGLQVSATSRAGNVRCSVTSPAGVDGKRKINCNAILCSFVVEQGKLVVQSLNTSKLSADAHGEAHKDRSVPLSIVSPDFAVKEGFLVEDYMSVHLLEGALRTAARLDGRLLKRAFSNKTGTGVITISFLCEKGGSKCKYLVRLVSDERTGDEDEEEPTFRVTKVIGHHSCDKNVGKPSDELREVLEAWPKATLGNPFKNSSGKKKGAEVEQSPSDEEDIKPEPGPSKLKKRARSPKVKEEEREEKKLKVKKEQ